MKKLIALALMLSLGFVAGCGDKPKAKEAVKQAEDAAKDASKKVEEAAKKVEAATKDAVKKVEEGAKKAEEAVKGAGDAAVKAVTPPAEPAAPKIEVPKDAPKAAPEAKKE